MRLRAWILGSALVAACSSGSDDGGAGGSAGGDCSSTPCFAPARCVEHCGDVPVEYGCCGCPTGLFEVSSCPADAGSEASSDAACGPELDAAATVACGSESCGPSEICVHPCCGGAPLPDGSACKPAPPFCAPADQIICGCGSTSCSHSSGCFGQLSGRQLSCVCA